MVLATVAGEPDPAAEALRRLGVMRVATKYPRMAARYFERHRPPGGDRRGQGLGRARAAHRARAEAIVDLTATGTTLRENGLVVREEIVASTARLIANPVAHKLKAAAIDDAAWSGLRAPLSACARPIRAGGRGARRRLAPAAASVADAVRRDRRRGVRRARRRGAARPTWRASTASAARCA